MVETLENDAEQAKVVELLSVSGLFDRGKGITVMSNPQFFEEGENSHLAPRAWSYTFGVFKKTNRTDFS